MTALNLPAALDGRSTELAQQFITWLETGVRLDGMFTEDVFVDLSLPQWRVQAQGPDAASQLRRDGHPFQGEVHAEALDGTSRGFLLQFEERWPAEGERWYCREMIHCVVTDGRISELAVYCTGDWSEVVQKQHAEQVRLVRP